MRPIFGTVAADKVVQISASDFVTPVSAASTYNTALAEGNTESVELEFIPQCI